MVANFVVNHLTDPRAGVRKLGRVTAPGGRLAMTIWPEEAAGWAPLVNQAFEEAGATPMPGIRLFPEFDFPRTVDGLAGVSAEARLTIVEAETLTGLWRVPAQNLWRGICGGVATPGARYLAQSAEVRREIARIFRFLATHWLVDGELQFECSAAYVLATR